MKKDAIEDWRAELALNVRKARKRLKLTQQELGAKAGIFQGTVAKIERRGYPLSMHNLYRLAHGLECTVHDLLPASSVDAIDDLL